MTAPGGCTKAQTCTAGCAPPRRDGSQSTRPQTAQGDPRCAESPRCWPLTVIGDGHAASSAGTSGQGSSCSVGRCCQCWSAASERKGPGPWTPGRLRLPRRSMSPRRLAHTHRSAQQGMIRHRDAGSHGRRNGASDGARRRRLDVARPLTSPAAHHHKRTQTSIENECSCVCFVLLL